MVKNIYNLLFYNVFQVAKVNHHAIFYISGICYRLAYYRNRKLVAVPVHVFAFAVIAVKCMPGFEGKLLGNPYFAHCTDVICGCKITKLKHVINVKVFSLYLGHLFKLNYMDDFQLNPLYEQIIDGLMGQHYSIADGFFSSEEIEALRNSLLQKYDAEQFKKSAIGNQANEKVMSAVRGDFILWLDESQADSAEKAFFEKIHDFAGYLNRTCYMGIQRQEFHYALYPEGTFYKRHLDTFQNDKSRKLSVVCYLNSEDWKPEFGGELTIYTNKNGTEEAINIYPLAGRVVVFESQLLEHEVKSVKQPRLSITGWLKTQG
jgi:SM-20-related protein